MQARFFLASLKPNLTAFFRTGLKGPYTVKAICGSTLHTLSWQRSASLLDYSNTNDSCDSSTDGALIQRSRPRIRRIRDRNHYPSPEAEAMLEYTFTVLEKACGTPEGLHLHEIARTPLPSKLRVTPRHRRSR